MNRSFYQILHPRPSADRNAAFTLVELVVVLAVLGLLVGLAIPALAGVRGQTRTAQCADNLRQYTLAMLLYGSDNNSRLPTRGGSWAWDMPVSVTDLLDRYGAHRQQMYCPAFPEQNADPHWFFISSSRVTGYANTLASGGGVAAQWQNSTIFPQPTAAGVNRLPAPHASQRVLVADVVISNSSQNNTNYATMLTYQWIEILGGSPVHHRTSHLVGTIPAGGNSGMLDGHVEWHGLQGMIPHSTSYPYFWW